MNEWRKEISLVPYVTRWPQSRFCSPSTSKLNAQYTHTKRTACIHLLLVNSSHQKKRCIKGSKKSWTLHFMAAWKGHIKEYINLICSTITHFVCIDKFLFGRICYLFRRISFLFGRISYFFGGIDVIFLDKKGFFRQINYLFGQIGILHDELGFV